MRKCPICCIRHDIRVKGTCLFQTKPHLFLIPLLDPDILIIEQITTMADDMDVDEEPKTKGRKEGKDSGKARFEVKKVNALEFVKRQEFFIILF